MISFSCPKCKAYLSVDDHQAASRYACPSCGQLMRVPTPPTTVQELSVSGTNFSANPPIFTPVVSEPASRIQVQYDAGRPFVTWPCSYCKVRLKASLDHAGQSIQCPACRQNLPIPDPNSSRFLPGAAAGSGSEEGAGRFVVAARPRSYVGLVVGLGIAMFLVVGTVVGLLIWQPWAGKAALSEDQIKFLPDNSDFVAAVNVQDMLASGAYQKFEAAAVRMSGQSFRQAEEQVRQQLGLGWSDLTRVMIGGKLSDQGEVTVVIGTKQAVTATDLLRKIRHGNFFTEEKVGPYKMYSNRQLGAPVKTFAFCVVSTSGVVVGPQAEVRKVLQRDKKPIFSPTLQAAMNRTDFSATIAAAVGKISAAARQKMNQDLAQLGNLQMMATGLDKTEGGTLEIRVGSDIQLKSLTFYSDAKTAQEMEKTAKGMMAFIQLMGLPPAVSELVKPLKFHVDGSTLITTMTINVDKVIKLIEDARALRRW